MSEVGKDVADQIGKAVQPVIDSWSAEVKAKTGVDGQALLSTLRAEAEAVK